MTLMRRSQNAILCRCEVRESSLISGILSFTLCSTHSLKSLRVMTSPGSPKLRSSQGLPGVIVLRTSWQLPVKRLLLLPPPHQRKGLKSAPMTKQGRGRGRGRERRRKRRGAWNVSVRTGARATRMIGARCTYPRHPVTSFLLRQWSSLDRNVSTALLSPLSLSVSVYLSVIQLYMYNIHSINYHLIISSPFSLIVFLSCSQCMDVLTSCRLFHQSPFGPIFSVWTSGWWTHNVLRLSVRHRCLEDLVTLLEQFYKQTQSRLLVFSLCSERINPKIRDWFQLSRRGSRGRAYGRTSPSFIKKKLKRRARNCSEHPASVLPPRPPPLQNRGSAPDNLIESGARLKGVM